MTKRRSTLSDKLSSGNEPKPGWRDTIRPSVPQEVEEETATQRRPAKRANRNKAKRKTYLLTPDLIERIEILAEEEHVGINELVRFLLSSSLDRIESGNLQIPTTPGRRRIAP